MGVPSGNSHLNLLSNSDTETDYYLGRNEKQQQQKNLATANTQQQKVN